MKDKILNILLILTVTAALTLTLARGQPEQESASLTLTALPTRIPTATPHPVDAYRARREETRAQEQALLRALAQSEQTSPETRAQAEKQLLEAAAWMETELAVEAALAAQGYGQALCVAREGAVTILLSQELTAQEAALILALAQEASGAAAENIRIAAC